MGVMTQMRDRAAIILFVLLVLFVLSMTIGGLVGGANIIDIITGKHPNALGVVDGTEIAYKQFNEAFARELEAFRNRTDSEPNENQLNFLRDQVWESIVRDILIQKTLNKKGIKAHDEEIIYRIFNAPPEILRNNPNFQNEQKQFDMARYQAALSDPRNAGQWKPVEDYLRLTLPYQDLQQRILSTVRVTDDEVKREYLKQNQKAKVKYILVSPARFLKENLEITDNEIKKYYKDHPDEFREEEKRKIQYVLFPLKATPEDSAEERRLAQDLIERLKEGEDFGELAEIYSEDTGSKDKGGDLGFFGKGTMVKPFEEAAFAARVGEIVGPVQSNFGLHIIKIEEKKVEKGEEKVRARHILLKFEPSPKTKENVREEAYYFVEEAKERSFEDIAASNDLEVQTSNFFPRGNGFVPGLGLNKSVSSFIFSNKVGKVGDVEETPQGFFVYRIAEIQKERIRPLEQVTSTIKNKLLSEKRMALAGELAQKVHEKILNGASFEQVATEDTLEVKATDFFTRSGFVSGVGRDAKFIGAAFALSQPGEISKPIEGIKGYYILKLIEKDKFDSKDYESKKETIARQILQKKQSQAFTNWYANLKAKAKIKDYRYKFF